MLDVKVRKWNGRTARIAFGTALAMVCLLTSGALRWHAAAMAAPQAQSVPSKTMPQSSLDDMPSVPEPTNNRLEAQRDRMWNDERRKKLVSDTDRLLQLATELKIEVDKSTRNELSVKVVQKAAEIEKLSHEVKERMKN